MIRYLHLAALSLVLAPSLVSAGPSVCDGIAGNLVGNCGFETGTFANWTLSGNQAFESLPGDTWANSGSYGAKFGPEGNPADPSTYGYMSQTLATTPGQTYSLTYYLENPNATSSPSVFEASWNGSVIPGSLQNPVPQTNYEAYTFNGLAATSSSTTLEFGFLQNPSYLGLDDISVVASDVVPTPEPGGYFVLLATGLGLLVLAKRYQRGGRAEAEVE